MSRPAFLIAVFFGILAAGVSFVLMHLTAVWVVLVLGGLIVLALSFLAPDKMEYWLVVFYLSLPLNITKMFFFSPEDVAELKAIYGVHAVENLVPLLYVFDIPLITALGLWLIRRISGGQTVRIPRGFVLVVGFLLWCVISLFGAEARLMSVTYILYQAKMALILLFITNVCSARRALRVLLGTMVLGLVIQAAMTGYSYAFQSGSRIFGDLFGAGYSEEEVHKGLARGFGHKTVYEEGSLLRGTGSVGSGNDQAKYFTIMLPLALISPLVARGALTRTIAIVAFTGGLAALYLTYSRGGLISSSCALIIAFFLMARRELLERRTVLALIALGLLAAIAAVPELYDFFTTRPGYFTKRFEQIYAGIEIASAHPITGVGINNFNVVIEPGSYGGVFDQMPIHNHYIRLICETGLVGGFLDLAFFAWLWLQAYRCTFLPDRFLSALSIALLAALTGTFVYWLDDIFYGVIIRAHIWTLGGAVLAVQELASPGRREPEFEAAGGA